MYITETKLLKWALYCNTIYIFLFVLVRPQGINVSKICITLLLVTSAIFINLLAFRNIKKIKLIPKKLRIVFCLLIFWGLITVIRSISLSVQDLVTNFGNVYMGWAWILPIALILGLKIENWRVVFKVIDVTFQLVIVVFLISLFFDNSYLQWAWLLRPVNFILLIGLYRYSLIKKIQIFVIIAILIAVATWVEQRMDFLFLAITLFFLLFNKISSIKLKKGILKYIMFGFILVLTYIFTVGYEPLSNFVGLIIEFQDSRTFLFKELFRDLNLLEKFFGRGSLGTYYSDFFEGTNRWYKLLGNKGWRGDNVIRITTEVGYLQMILKGGFVMLILYSILGFYAAYLALFKSNNAFIKSLGYYILIILMLSIVSLRPTFTLMFIVFWIAIGTVLVKKYRVMTNKEINIFIKNRNN